MDQEENIDNASNDDVELKSDQESEEDKDLDEEENSQDDEESDEDENEMSQDETDIEKEKAGEEEYNLKLNELENIINQDKFQYQSYVEIIKLTRDKGEFNKLREYRQKMSQVFPLSENLWLEWVKDEQKFMDNDEDRKKVDQLFQKAVEDYLSVELWLEYIQFSIGGMGEENGIENVRNICERAISFAGLHVTKGYTLWEVYREFETALLAGYQQSSAGSIQTPEQTKQINVQIDKILRLFKEQLAICLDNLESTYEELKQFDESQAINEKIKSLYESSLAKYKQIEPFETALANAAQDPIKKLAEYNNYLDFELKLVKDLESSSKNSKLISNKNNQLDYHRLRLKCLFERAIADDSNCLDVNLWLKYINYLNEEEARESSEQNKIFNKNVFKRSIRNCYWSSNLWINYALNAEKSASDSDLVKNIYKEAMVSGLQTSEDYLQMWHAYLGFLRRNLLSNFEMETPERKEEITEELRDTFEKAIDQLFNYFKLAGDPTFSLEKYWAQIEAKYFKSMERTRKIYNERILAKSNLGEYSSEVWLEYYALEMQFGDEKHQRKLLNRALNELKDDREKEIIYEVLLKFEKLNGNISQFSSINEKYEQFKQKVLAELSKKKESQQKSNNVNNKQQSKQSQKHEKFKKEEKPKAAKKEDKETNNLKRKKSENENQDASKLKDKDGFAIPSLPGSSLEQPTSKKQRSETSISTTEFKKSDDVGNNCKVFISNLKFDVDENKVKECFEKEPGFKGLRLIKHWSGKTKGYGYVDFEKPEQAEKALKLDRSMIDGRPVFVSKNEDKSLDFGQNKFKFATNLEKNKLFVSGLPFSTDKPALEEIFKAFGKLKEVRIVTYKSGKSKGLAYVEFEDEQSASKALIQTDGMLIGENQITVAISNPPKRKQPLDLRPETDSKEKPEEIKRSLGSGSVGSRTSQPVTSVASFVPRSQQLMSRKKTLNLK